MSVGQVRRVRQVREVRQVRGPAEHRLSVMRRVPLVPGVPVVPDVPGVPVVPTLIAILFCLSCGGPFSRQYEYEEQLYLDVDGSATVILNSSVNALRVLRGFEAAAPTARPDRDDVRRRVEAQGCPVTRVGRPWSRRGRYFVQIRFATDDVRTLSRCPLLAWSRYELKPDDSGTLRFEQKVGPSANGEKEVLAADEIMAFRLHLPSRIRRHNARRLEDNEVADIERGNILSWEQTLADRRAGKPVAIEVVMDAESILYNTLWIFAGTIAAAVMTLAGAVWLMKRRGKKGSVPAVPRVP